MAGTVTIGAMRYDLIADTEKFEKSMTATRSELRQSEAAFRKTMTPIQKFEAELEKLNNLRRKGLITAETYRRAIQRERDAYVQATTAARGYSKEMAFASTEAKNFVRGFAGIATVSAAFRGIQQSLANIDDVAKKARALGIAGNELVTFRLAAEQIAGLNAQTTDMAIQRLTRRIGELATGTGEAAKAAKRLGLDGRELAQAGTVEAFRRIADAIANVKDETEQLAIAQKFFDSEGARLVTLLREGGDVFDEYAEKVERFGMAFTPEQRKKVEDFNDEISNLRAGLRGLAENAAVAASELRPVVELGTNLTTAPRDVGQQAGEVAETAVRSNPLFRLQAAMLRSMGMDPQSIVDRELREAARVRQVIESTERQERAEAAALQSRQAISQGGFMLGQQIGMAAQGEGPVVETLTEISETLAEQLRLIRENRSEPDFSDRVLY